MIFLKNTKNQVLFKSEIEFLDEAKVISLKMLKLSYFIRLISKVNVFFFLFKTRILHQKWPWKFAIKDGGGDLRLDCDVIRINIIITWISYDYLPLMWISSYLNCTFINFLTSITGTLVCFYYLLQASKTWAHKKQNLSLQILIFF